MKKRAFLYIILTGILWGTSGVFVRALSPYGFSTLQMTAMRGGVAAIAFVLYAIFFNRKAFLTNAKELILYALSGLCIFLTSACYFACMQRTSVSVAVILMYTAPVIVMIYSVLFLGERFTFKKAISVFFMLAGCVLVSGLGGGMKFDAYGIFIGLCSGLAYSGYNIFTKIQMRKKCNPFSASLYCFIFMAITAVIFSNSSDMLKLVSQNFSKVLPLCASIGIVTCVLPYFLYTIALKELPVGTAAVLSVVEPMAATLISIFIFKEHADLFSICGIVLILGAVFLLGKSQT